MNIDKNLLTTVVMLSFGYQGKKILSKAKREDQQRAKVELAVKEDDRRQAAINRAST